VVFNWEKDDYDKKFHVQFYSSAYNATVESGEGYSLDTYTEVPNYSFTRDENEGIFGSLQRKYGIQVKSVNYFNVESNNWKWYQYEDQPPAAISGLNATGGFRTVLFNWNQCTAADFSHYIVRTRENTGAYGGTAETQTNSYLKALSSTGIVGDRIGIEVKAVDVLLQEGLSATASAVTIGAKYYASDFSIVPSNSDGDGLETLRVLYDSVLDGSAVTMSAGDWVQYEYPVEYVYNASTLWTNKDLHMYLGYYDNNDKTWRYLAGNASHGLSGGKLLEYAAEVSAQSNYYSTSRESDGKIRVVWPTSRQSDKVKLFNYDTPDVRLYEWKNNVFVLADEIVAGKLQLSQGVIIASSPTADHGVVLDTDGFAMYYNGVRNVYIRNDGYAEFGAIGQNQMTISTGGIVTIDDLISADVIQSRVAEIGNQHVRIDESGVYVSDDNAENPKTGDQRSFLRASDGAVLVQEMNSYIEFYSQNIMCAPTARSDSIASLGVDVLSEDRIFTVGFILHAPYYTGVLNTVWDLNTENPVMDTTGIELDLEAPVDCAALSATHGVVVSNPYSDRSKVLWQRVGGLDNTLTADFDLYPTGSFSVGGTAELYSGYVIRKIADNKMAVFYASWFDEPYYSINFRIISFENSQTGSLSNEYVFSPSGSYKQFIKPRFTLLRDNKGYFAWGNDSQKVFGTWFNGSGETGHPVEIIGTAEYPAMYEIMTLSETAVACFYNDKYKMITISGATSIVGDEQVLVSTAYQPVGVIPKTFDSAYVDYATADDTHYIFSSFVTGLHATPEFHSMDVVLNDPNKTITLSYAKMMTLTGSKSLTWAPVGSKGYFSNHILYPFNWYSKAKIDSNRLIFGSSKTLDEPLIGDNYTYLDLNSGYIKWALVSGAQREEYDIEFDSDISVYGKYVDMYDATSSYRVWFSGDGLSSKPYLLASMLICMMLHLLTEFGFLVMV